MRSLSALLRDCLSTPPFSASHAPPLSPPCRTPHLSSSIMLPPSARTLRRACWRLPGAARACAFSRIIAHAAPLCLSYQHLFASPSRPRAAAQMTAYRRIFALRWFLLVGAHGGNAHGVNNGGRRRGGIERTALANVSANGVKRRGGGNGSRDSCNMAAYRATATYQRVTRVGSWRRKQRRQAAATSIETTLSAQNSAFNAVASCAARTRLPLAA